MAANVSPPVPYESKWLNAKKRCQTPFSAYANKPAPTDRPDIGYAMIFPGMTIVKILFVDIVPALL